ncbi:hypothetical protein CEXT_546381 [Caerostris extrusa]|uniref:Uncharacterized protein n=1 Tax=Caerostris extrusa TaxID=172846 RepID=A0AAV4XKV0_CAEEX|nr:hypothetical protein CEXT_546381 [Caerostris extrusa]
MSGNRLQPSVIPDHPSRRFPSNIALPLLLPSGPLNQNSIMESELSSLTRGRANFCGVTLDKSKATTFRKERTRTSRDELLIFEKYIDVEEVKYFYLIVGKK